MTAVSVKLPDVRRIVDADKRDGKIVDIVTVTVASDGKTMSVVYDNRTAHRTEAVTVWRI